MLGTQILGSQPQQLELTRILPQFTHRERHAGSPGRAALVFVANFFEGLSLLYDLVWLCRRRYWRFAEPGA
jgi:hypothetical protein